MAREKILVVDDEAHIRQALSAALESEGYVVETAANGKEGVQKCRDFRPALMFLDVRMPVLDGHMASIEIKYDEKLKDTRIIFLTAQADEDSRNFGLGHGAELYLTKPFEVEQLLKIVDELLHPYGDARSKAAPSTAPAVAPVAIDAGARARYLEALKKKMGKK